MSDRRNHERRCSEPYIGFIHVSAYNDLIAGNPKDKWKASYRRARRAGTAYMPPQWVMLKYPVHDIPTEIGHIESFRIHGNFDK